MARKRRDKKQKERDFAALQLHAAEQEALFAEHRAKQASRSTSFSPSSIPPNRGENPPFHPETRPGVDNFSGEPSTATQEQTYGHIGNGRQKLVEVRTSTKVNEHPSTNTVSRNTMGWENETTTTRTSDFSHTPGRMTTKTQKVVRKHGLPPRVENRFMTRILEDSIGKKQAREALGKWNFANKRGPT